MAISYLVIGTLFLSLNLLQPGQLMFKINRSIGIVELLHRQLYANNDQKLIFDVYYILDFLYTLRYTFVHTTCVSHLLFTRSVS